MPARDTLHNTAAQDTLRVLVIEDEQRYREFLLDVLGDMNCNPTGLATAGDALSVLQNNEFDAILLDLNLPVMDGMSFLERLRKRFSKLPVIILTGVGDLKNAQQAIRLGVTDFLTKPCHLGDIERALDRVRRQIAGHQSTRSTTVGDDDQINTKPVESIAELERRAIIDALRANLNNRSAAAVALGISRRTLYNKLREYDLGDAIA